MKPVVLILALLPLCAAAEPLHQTEVQRALIQRDRQSAEFARPELRDLHTRQDMQQLPERPDERGAQSRERDAYPRAERPAATPATPAPRPLPSPLPGGPAPGIDPIPVQGRGG